jgi:hypothetical protein
MNVFAHEAPTILRLRDELPALAGRVYATGAKEAAGWLPALAKMSPSIGVHVSMIAPDADPAKDPEHWGSDSQGMTLRTTVTLIVRELAPSEQIEELPARTIAGPLLGAVVCALTGWRPAESYSPYRWVRGTEPKDSLQTGVYQLHFETYLS